MPTTSAESPSSSALTHFCAVAPSPAAGSGSAFAHDHPSASVFRPLKTIPLRVLIVIATFSPGPYAERTFASTMTDPGALMLLLPSRGERRTVTSGSGAGTTMTVAWPPASSGLSSMSVFEIDSTSQMTGFSVTFAVFATRPSRVSVSENVLGGRSGPLWVQTVGAAGLSHDQPSPLTLTLVMPRSFGRTLRKVKLPDCVSVPVGKRRMSALNLPPGYTRPTTLTSTHTLAMTVLSSPAAEPTDAPASGSGPSSWTIASSFLRSMSSAVSALKRMCAHSARSSFAPSMSPALVLSATSVTSESGGSGKAASGPIWNWRSALALLPGGRSAFFVPSAVFSVYVHVRPLQTQPIEPTAESAVIAGAALVNVTVAGRLLIVNLIGAFWPA